MMEANYRNKTTALNKQREAVEAKQAEIDSQLEDARSLLEDQIANLESKEMQELKEDDPEAYLKEFEKVQAKTKKFEQLKSKREQEQQARQNKLIEKERELLFDAFPEWKNDQAKMAKDSEDLFKSLKGVGYTDDELASTTDHRLFVVASKLQQLENIQKANLEAKEVKTKPKNSKPGVPKSKEERAAQDTQKMRSKLRKTGSIHDAVRLLNM